MALNHHLPGDSFCILKDALYMVFKSDDSPSYDQQQQSNYVVFRNDRSLVYTAFFADFGPLNLALTFRFCNDLLDASRKAKEKGQVVLYSCSDHPHKRSIGALLICAYQIWMLNLPIEEAYSPFIGIDPSLIPFRDAGFCINIYPITVLDCAKALCKAKNLGHFNVKSFSIVQFQHMAKLQHGDFSWIIPGKFIAFSGPLSKRRPLSQGVFSLAPEEYVPLLKKMNVTCIVRFNSKCYDRTVFVASGIRHVDLLYEDGSNPSDFILQSFLQLCEQEKGAIAVHCKAGLGRTGTNIAAYMMKHYRYTAKESIAWCRLCRPGSVVGPQQQYLESIETRMYEEGDLYRERHRFSPAVTIGDKSADEPSMSGTSTDDGADDKRVKTPSNTFSNTFSSNNSNSAKTLHGSSATAAGGGGGVSMPKLTPSISSSSLLSKPTAILSGGKMNVDNNSCSSIFSTPINNSNTTAALLTPSPINIHQRPSTSGSLLSVKHQDKDYIPPQHSSSLHGSSSPPPISPSGYSLSRKSPSNINKYFQITPLSSTEATAVAAVASSTTTSSSFILSVPSQQTKSVIRPTTSTSISPSSFSPSPSKDNMGNSATTNSASRSTPLYAFSAGNSSSFDSNRPRSSSGGGDTPWTTTTHQTAGSVARRGSPARRKLY